ncbi:MAG: heat-inducible transcriptional repressor HrcA [Parachlamydiaceae bacterium]|nr:heat-inducible transcriptional repressor HrcA [Parachlamydiaceae bacterium]
MSHVVNTTDSKRSKKQDREFRVLIGLVDYYLRTGKPVGSNTLKDAGFEELSSATIRNYFAKLEEDGYLTQQHTSGGRLPTPLALRTYAKEYQHALQSLNPKEEQLLKEIRLTETREIASFLQKSAESLSTLTQSAVFLSAPRFDHDYIVGLKLVPIDHARCLCVIITDFGVIRTEVLPLEHKLSSFAAKRIESYFQWRLTGLNQPENFEPGEEELAHKLYNELFMRYIVGYSNFIDTELYRTGLSKLLAYPEFHDASSLSSSLALFENAHNMRLLIKDCCKTGHLKFWISEDLDTYTNVTPDCAIVALPYYINQSIAGAVGILGPTRMPYREIFSFLNGFSASISEALTRNLYKFKITFRQPESKTEALLEQDYRLLLLEDKGVTSNDQT